jgi:exodeoxyribonuclease VII large subunit
MNFLSVPYKEKDAVKELGARWDATMKKWYVPIGLDLSKFSQWLEAAPDQQTGIVPAQGETPNLPAETGKGIRLTVLLARISKAVEVAMPIAEWVMAEIGAINARQQNIYLDLVEHDGEGREIAKTRGTIWKSVSGKLLAKFKENTGAELAAGIKVMVKVQAQFNGQYGLSLNIIDIDPSYTMGDMAAKLRRIRESLVKDGIYESNKALAMPADFFRVAIISPESAAGLSDFKQEANLLAEYGICKFDYFSAVFQGERAGNEIFKAIAKALSVHEADPYDALVIIRGGGNVADLNWLNDETLARQICTSPLPVLAGIGHSTDSTILDEVARYSFDTPSKVIGHIVQTVASVTDTAQNYADEILRGAEKQSLLAEQRMESDWREIKSGAVHLLEQASERVDNSHTWMVQQAITQADTAAIAMGHAFESVSSSAQALVLQAGAGVDSIYKLSVQGAVAAMGMAEQSAKVLMDETIRSAQGKADRAEELSRETISQIIALGPMHTMKRGFAIVRDGQGGVVTCVAQARNSHHLEIQFADGNININQKEQ